MPSWPEIPTPIWAAETNDLSQSKTHVKVVIIVNKGSLSKTMIQRRK